MASGFTLVITSISGPTPALKALARAASDSGSEFILVGDERTPDTVIDGCDYYSLGRQQELEFEFAALCPVGHYTRKNVGYLLAMERGASVIVETDDDTVASQQFWEPRERSQAVPSIGGAGWVNVYRYFTDAVIWPRGFPLDVARLGVPVYDTLPIITLDCPIQQGLVDQDPDVDAIYRMLFQIPFTFERQTSVALTAGSWCPFNSQNTSWWPAAFPLMYLPSSCSFRMTDIWRSFVAQRLAWVNGWAIGFNGATVRQARNAHNLAIDFADEVSGYLSNRAICVALEALDLEPGVERLAENMRVAYATLVDRGWLDLTELALLDAWLVDVDSALRAPSPSLC